MLRSPEGGRFPSCYRRLWMFSEEAKVLGERVLLVDIDLVPTADWSPLFAPTTDFVGWRPYRDWNGRGAQNKRYGGGIYLITPGSRTQVWTDFNRAPAHAIQKARAAGYRGSDQAWISYRLGPSEKIYGKDAGIYSIRDFPGGGERGQESLKLPADARLVQFNGPAKPWDPRAQRIPWVRENFR